MMHEKKEAFDACPYKRSLRNIYEFVDIRPRFEHAQFAHALVDLIKTYSLESPEDIPDPANSHLYFQQYEKITQISQLDCMFLSLKHKMFGDFIITLSDEEATWLAKKAFPKKGEDDKTKWSGGAVDCGMLEVPDFLQNSIDLIVARADPDLVLFWRNRKEKASYQKISLLYRTYFLMFASVNDLITVCNGGPSDAATELKLKPKLVTAQLHTDKFKLYDSKNRRAVLPRLNSIFNESLKGFNLNVFLSNKVFTDGGSLPKELPEEINDEVLLQAKADVAKQQLNNLQVKSVLDCALGSFVTRAPVFVAFYKQLAKEMQSSSRLQSLLQSVISGLYVVLTGSFLGVFVSVSTLFRLPLQFIYYAYEVVEVCMPGWGMDDFLPQDFLDALRWQDKKNNWQTYLNTLDSCYIKKDFWSDFSRRKANKACYDEHVSSLGIPFDENKDYVKFIKDTGFTYSQSHRYSEQAKSIDGSLIRYNWTRLFLMPIVWHIIKKGLWHEKYKTFGKILTLPLLLCVNLVSAALLLVFSFCFILCEDVIPYVFYSTLCCALIILQSIIILLNPLHIFGKLFEKNRSNTDVKILLAIFCMVGFSCLGINYYFAMAVLNIQLVMQVSAGCLYTLIGIFTSILPNIKGAPEVAHKKQNSSLDLDVVPIAAEILDNKKDEQSKEEEWGVVDLFPEGFFSSEFKESSGVRALSLGGADEMD